MSTDWITYLNYMSTWETESDANIDRVIDEHNVFVNLGDFDSDTASNKEFDKLNKLATTLRDETVEADAIQMAADAAAIATLYTFGYGMAAFALLEAAHTLKGAKISKDATELNNNLASVDTDISSNITDTVKLYTVAYKLDNNLIASKAPKGLDTRQCCSLLMQFMAEVQRHNNGQLDAAAFRRFAASARILYNSPTPKRSTGSTTLLIR